VEYITVQRDYAVLSTVSEIARNKATSCQATATSHPHILIVKGPSITECAPYANSL